MIFSKIKHLLDFKSAAPGVLEKSTSGTLAVREVNWDGFALKETYPSPFDPYDVGPVFLDFNPLFGVETGSVGAYAPATPGQQVTRWRDQSLSQNHALRIPDYNNLPVLSSEDGIVHVESNDSNAGLVLSSMVPFGPKTFYVVANKMAGIFLEWGFSGAVPGNFGIGVDAGNAGGYCREMPYAYRNSPLNPYVPGVGYYTGWMILCVVCGVAPLGCVTSKQPWSEVPFEVGYGVNNSYPGLFARNRFSYMDLGSRSACRRVMGFTGAHSPSARKIMMEYLSAEYNIPIEVAL